MLTLKLYSLSIVLAVLVVKGILDKKDAEKLIENLGDKVVPDSFDEMVNEITNALNI